MARSLAERQEAHQKQKQLVAENEGKLKEAERKARIRKLIAAGGLVEKANLIDLEANALYGALLELAKYADDEKRVERWAALGGKAFEREARTKDEGKVGVVMSFPDKLAKEATTVLRGAGFRYNNILRHWEGMAHLEEARALATGHGGTARAVA